MTNLRILRASCLVLTFAVAVAAWVPAAVAAPQHKAKTPGAQKAVRNSRGSLVRARGALGQDLFLATVSGNLTGVRSLMKHGADPDAYNSLDMTPLFLASGMGQTKVMEALLASGAKLNLDTPYGPPLMNACLTGAVPAIQLLLSRGAKIDVTRPDGITPLMFVARGGLVPIVNELLKRKANVNATDGDGATALTFAAREGQTEVGRVLLAAGAKVDAPDSHGWSPLTYAAISGHAEFVRLLLEKGANPNFRDVRGRTPLLLSACYGDHPEVIKALLQAGADAKVTDPSKRSAYSLAAARGHVECAKLLATPGTAPDGLEASDAQRTITQALQLSTSAIGHSMNVFHQAAGCVSCHHEGLGRLASGVAAGRGFSIEKAIEHDYSERVASTVDGLCSVHLQALKDPSAMKKVPLIEMGDVAIYYGYMLAGMAAYQQPRTQAAGAMAMVLARQQLPMGNWMFGLPRVPMESSNFTMTALAVQALRTFGPAAYAKEIDRRIGKAKAWLLAARPQNSEDRAFRLLGLKWAGANDGERNKALEELRAQQRPDGGWSQLPDLQSDAYATGQALYAIHVGGGTPTSDPVYQRGVKFLLRTQEEDGSWFVIKRALPANNYFDAGFPHGISQFTSFNATCWATMALAQTVERQRARQTANRL